MSSETRYTVKEENDGRWCVISGKERVKRYGPWALDTEGDPEPPRQYFSSFSAALDFMKKDELESRTTTLSDIIARGENVGQWIKSLGQGAHIVP